MLSAFAFLKTEYKIQEQDIIFQELGSGSRPGCQVTSKNQQNSGQPF